MRLRWTAAAAKDLYQIVRYIRRDKHTVSDAVTYSGRAP